MDKAHENIGWENKPSDKTPINKRNLDKMDTSIDIIDDRVIALDTTKFNAVDAQGLIKSITFNRANGVFTITYFNGAKATIDTMLEKLAVNFDFDENAQQLVIILDDGTEKRVDLSAFIKPIEFIDSDTIAWQLLDNGTVSAIVKEGSIQEKHLRPDYLADIRVESAKAQAGKESAESSARRAESYAVGGTGTRPGEDKDNAKFFYEQIKDFSGSEKRELTQAEYDALTDAEKNNGVVYYITDADTAPKLQNTFTEIGDGTNRIVAQEPQDAVVFAAGDNMSVTADPTRNRVTISGNYKEASESSPGLMGPEDKKKLDGMEDGATRVVVDSELLALSENPVQNKAVKAALDKKADIQSPTLTGIPKAPTAGSATNNTQIATTAFANTAVANHNASETAHDDIRRLVSGLSQRLDALADSDDTTLDQLSEIVAYIKANRGLIDSITTSKVNVSDIVDSLTSTATNRPLSAKQGKVLSDLITSLSSSVPSASSTSPKAPGTASTGTEDAYARGDHVHPAQTSVSGNAGTATKLAAARNINGMGFDGSANRVNYGTCGTAAGTAAKTVSCTGFSLVTGAEITVKFTATNTAASPTLNVNGTGAKPIYYRGSAIAAGCLAANRTYTFRYNGTQWDLTGDIDTGAFYGVCTNSNSYSAKAVDVQGFKLEEGVHVTVSFPNGNDANTITLNVNGTGANPVTSGGGDPVFPKGSVCEFVYDGGNYALISDGRIKYVSKSLSSPGWYRVASLQSNGGTLLFSIDRIYGTSEKPRGDLLSLTFGLGGGAFTQLNGYGEGTGVSRVRLVMSNKIAYLEVYYTLSAANTVCIALWPGRYECPNTSTVNFTAGEIPSGYTATEFELTKYQGGMKASMFEGELLGSSCAVKFDLVRDTVKYRAFASLPIPSNVGYNASSYNFLVSGLGTIEHNRDGIYLVSCGTRGTIHMLATELGALPSENHVEFGYWIEGDAVMFGLKQAQYSRQAYVHLLSDNALNISGEKIGNLYDSTTAPSGWTKASYRKFVTGIKGNAESSYRDGNVNLTAENIGALPLSGGTMNGNINMKGYAVNYSGISTHLEGANGKAAINGTTSPGEHSVIARMLSSNGRFMDCAYRDARTIEYMSNERFEEGTNSPNHTLRLLYEDGNSKFPGTVNAKNFYIDGKGDALPTRQLTQAQYDALSSTAKMNGTIYFITDAD